MAWNLFLVFGPIVALGALYTFSLQGPNVGVPALALSAPPFWAGIRLLRGRPVPPWCVAVGLLTTGLIGLLWAWMIGEGIADDGLGVGHVVSAGVLLAVATVTAGSLVHSVRELSPVSS